jgi:hypothetical protein
MSRDRLLFPTIALGWLPEHRCSGGVVLGKLMRVENLFALIFAGEFKGVGT